jgi:hypothetical protein
LEFVPDCKLSGNLIGPQQVVGIQPLDVISLAEGKGSVSRRGCTLIFLGDNTDRRGFELPRNSQCMIGGAVIYDDNLFALPRLLERGPERIREPFLRVIRRDEN